MYKLSFLILSVMFLFFIKGRNVAFETDVYITNAKGKSFEKNTKISQQPLKNVDNTLTIFPEKTFQKVVGFGGAFTESSAYVLSKLSPENQKKIIDAYFAEDGAAYSLCRTHINSCDFSLNNYAYATQTNDFDLQNFSIERDEKLLIPLIKKAQKTSKEGFKLIASPWTAPPWMKDNNSWVGGKLKKECYDVWALYYAKYFEAYQKNGIDFWGFTVINEPNGNGNKWESMHFSPQEMGDFVTNHLCPSLSKNGFQHLKILGYDQNRLDLKNWANELYGNTENVEHFDGMAVHWYDSTFEVFDDYLQYTHHKAPNKFLIQTEACIDDEMPVWQNDIWYWRPHATDWGFKWATNEQKYLHPEYVPVYRYADDIIGCMNNYVQGWIDWNMVLNRQGGPNWAENWCISPVIADEQNDEVYFTPLYYVMKHFSKFIRPEAVRLGFDLQNKNLNTTVFRNTDNSVVIVVLNKETKAQNLQIKMGNYQKTIRIEEESLQTIHIKNIGKDAKQ